MLRAEKLASSARGARCQSLPERRLPKLREQLVPDIVAADRHEARGQDMPRCGGTHPLRCSARSQHLQHILAAVRWRIAAAVLDPVEVVRHPPLVALRIDPEHHLLADLDQVERDQDPVDRHQFGPVGARKGRLGLQAGEGIAAIRRMLAPIGPDDVRGDQADAGVLEQRLVLGVELVPVPEPAALAGVLAGADLAEIDPGDRCVGVGSGLRRRLVPAAGFRGLAIGRPSPRLPGSGHHRDIADGRGSGKGLPARWSATGLTDSVNAGTTP